MRYVMPFQRLLMNQVAMSIDEVAKDGRSRGILLIGRSGTGKSFALDLMKGRWPDSISGIQPIVPFCRVTVGTSSQPRSLLRRVLAATGKPESVTQRLSLDRLESQALDALDAAENRVLAIEEFHNAVLASDTRFRKTFTDLIKNMWNAEGYRARVFVVSGTEALITPFDSADELGSRFSCRIFAPSLWFDSDSGPRTFRCVAREMADVRGLLSLIDFDDALLVARLLLSTGAHLRRLDSLYARVATLLAQSDQRIDCAALLAQAFDQVLAKGEMPVNCFRWDDEQVRLRVKGLTRSSRSE